MLEKIQNVQSEEELVDLIEPYLDSLNTEKLGCNTVSSLKKHEIWGCIAKAAEKDGHMELSKIMFSAEERWSELEEAREAALG